jgi:hypothetical protein
MQNIKTITGESIYIATLKKPVKLRKKKPDRGTPIYVLWLFATFACFGLALVHHLNS